MTNLLTTTTGFSEFTPTLAFGSFLPGGWEWIVLLLVGLLIFGRRLPEVGRNIGKTVVEFRRGIKDIENDVEAEARRERSSLPAGEQQAALEPDDRAVAQPTAAPKTSEA